MPSKKRKYNARFPAGRIKKIMQTDEEVGKVAQAVPIIILMATPRTLELFVESLLSKAMQVTMSRNAKTLSPSHVKQCILAESRFDFLRDLVKNIPDVSAAEEKEMQMSAESSPNSSRHSDITTPRKIVREDSNSSSSCDTRVTRDTLKRALSAETDVKPIKTETVTSMTTVSPTTATLPMSSTTLPMPSVTQPLPSATPLPTTSLPVTTANLSLLPTSTPPLPSRLPHTVTTCETAIDLTKKSEAPLRTANFYQETLVEQVQHRSVITLNPKYTTPQPSTSNFPTTSYSDLTSVQVPVQRNLTHVEVPVQRIEVPKSEKPLFYVDVSQNNNVTKMQAPRTPVTPIINIDFSKNLDNPEIKVLDSSVGNIVGVNKDKKIQRQNSKSKEKKEKVNAPVNIDHINSGNLQIDEDYDT